MQTMVHEPWVVQIRTPDHDQQASTRAPEAPHVTEPRPEKNEQQTSAIIPISIKKDMLKKEASKIVGGLSAPGKMPCYSINLAGNRMQDRRQAPLRSLIGPCAMTAMLLKNRYRMPMQQNAMGRRLGALLTPAMGPGYDYADHRPEVLPLARLRGPAISHASQEHIRSMRTAHPDTQHWLPTREAGLMKLI